MSETYENMKKWLRDLGFILLTEDDKQIINTRFSEADEVFDLTIRVDEEDFYSEFIICTGLYMYESVARRKDKTKSARNWSLENCLWVMMMS